MHPNIRLPAPGENLLRYNHHPDKVWQHLLDVPMPARSAASPAASTSASGSIALFDSSAPGDRSCYHRF
jgi:hypothetical protein